MKSFTMLELPAISRNISEHYMNTSPSDRISSYLKLAIQLFDLLHLLLKCLNWTTRLEKILDEVQTGDLVCFHRGLFIHHAVYVGRGHAVHHHLGDCDGEVIEATLEYLAKGDLMRAYRITDTAFSPREIAARARSRIGLLPYSLHGGNCEHFTSWVYYGVHASKQLSYLCPYQQRLLQMVKHGTTPEEEQVPDWEEDEPRNRVKKLSKQKKQSKKASLKKSKQQKEGVPFQQQSENGRSEIQSQENGHQQESQQLQRDKQHAKNEQQEPNSSPNEIQQKFEPNQELESQKVQPAQQSRDAISENFDQNPISRYQQDETAGDDDSEVGFVFVPPRPVKYRPAKSKTQLACNHLRSCLKVLTVQAVVGLAAVPLNRCGLQADNLLHLGQKWSARRQKRRQSRQEEAQRSEESNHRPSEHVGLQEE